MVPRSEKEQMELVSTTLPSMPALSAMWFEVGMVTILLQD
jgi:hypothetical protein